MDWTFDKDRLAAVAGTALFEALIGYALIVGLAPGLPGRIGGELKLFTIAEAPPPEEREAPVPRPERAPKTEGAAAPPNLKAKPSEIVAPPPIVPLVVPPPVIVAPKAGPGSDPSAGAAVVPGPGTGSGGEGQGTGSGDSGYGDGGGGGTPARYLRGRIRDTDYPREAREAGLQGKLVARYEIDAKGRVTRCSIVESSGSPILDATTCRLVMERYRFRPARDARGRAIQDWLMEDHQWEIVGPE